MTTRRDALLTLPLLCAAARIHAQVPVAGPRKRLGYLGPNPDPKTPPEQRPFGIGMRQKGWIHGDNLLREFAYTDGQPFEQLAQLADELVRKRVDAILTFGAVQTVAAARATRTIPIVFVYVAFPVEVGLVDSYARPGRNVTGLALFAGVEVVIKTLECLKEVMPTARRVLCVNSAESRYLPTVAGGRFDQVAAFEASARNLGFEPQLRYVRAAHAVDDIDAAFSDVTAWRAQAVVVGPGQYPETRQRIAELSLRHRLPSVFVTREDFDGGGLLFYGRGKGEDAYMLKRLVEYVDQVLRGKAPADLPVELPNRYELAINLTTAKALGLTIPPSLLARADEVIQ